MSTKPKTADAKEEKAMTATERRTRIAEIVSLMGSEDTAPEDIAKLATELASLRGEEKKAKEALSGEVHNIVQQLIALRRDHGITFASLQNEMVDGEIPFPKADVVDYCQRQGWMPSVAPRAGKTAANQGEKRTRTLDSSAPLFAGVKTPSGKGIPPTLTLNKAKNRDFGQFSSAGFKAIYEANKDGFEEELKKYLTDAGKEFFANEDKDQAIWKAFVHHHKTKPLPPAKKTA